MRQLYYILASSMMLIVFFSCTNRQTTSTSSNEQAKADSLLIVHKQEALERERKFAALGDTVFGTVCYGMNKEQYLQAVDSFVKPLKKNPSDFYFLFSGYKFRIYGPSNVEGNNQKSVSGFRYGIHNILIEDFNCSLLFEKKLFVVYWESERIYYGSYNSIVKDLGGMVSIFSKKYGIPNIDNTQNFHRNNVIAYWETEKRKIKISYRDLVGYERNKYMDENYPNDYQYKLSVLFLNKEAKKEVDEYIKPILQKDKDDYLEQRRQDSIRTANAL